jgi:hypothetical protein
MSAFLEYYSDPDQAADRREIRSLLRCDETSAVTVQLLLGVCLGLDDLGSEMLALTQVTEEDPDVD